MNQKNLRSAICFKKFKKWRRLKKFNMFYSSKIVMRRLYASSRARYRICVPACACACAHTRSRGTRVYMRSRGTRV